VAWWDQTYVVSVWDVLLGVLLGLGVGLALFFLREHYLRWRSAVHYVWMEDATTGHTYEYIMYGTGEWCEGIKQYMLCLVPTDPAGRPREDAEMVNAATRMSPEELSKWPVLWHEWQAPIYQRLYHVWVLDVALFPARLPPAPQWVRPPPMFPFWVKFWSCVVMCCLFGASVSYLYAIALGWPSWLSILWASGGGAVHAPLPFAVRKLYDWRRPPIVEGPVEWEVAPYAPRRIEVPAVEITYDELRVDAESRARELVGDPRTEILPIYLYLQELRPRDRVSIFISRKRYSDDDGEPLMTEWELATHRQARAFLRATGQELVHLRRQLSRAMAELDQLHSKTMSLEEELMHAHRVSAEALNHLEEQALIDRISARIENTRLLAIVRAIQSEEDARAVLGPPEEVLRQPSRQEIEEEVEGELRRRGLRRRHRPEYGGRDNDKGFWTRFLRRKGE